MGIERLDIDITFFFLFAWKKKKSDYTYLLMCSSFFFQTYFSNPLNNKKEFILRDFYSCAFFRKASRDLLDLFYERFARLAAKLRALLVIKTMNFWITNCLLRNSKKKDVCKFINFFYDLNFYDFGKMKIIVLCCKKYNCQILTFFCTLWYFLSKWILSNSMSKLGKIDQFSKKSFGRNCQIKHDTENLNFSNE